MANPQIVDIVRNELSNGIRLDKIKQALEKQGYQKGDINKAVSQIYDNKEFSKNFGDMLSEKSKIIFLSVFMAVYTFSIILIRISNIKFDYFTHPLRTILSAPSGGVQLNILLLICGILFLSLSLAILLVCVLRDQKFDIEILISLILATVITLIVVGFSLPKGIIILGFAVALFLFVQKIIESERIFKKISSSYVVSYSFSNSIRIFGFAVAIAVFVFLSMNPTVAHDEIAQIFSEKMGVDIDNLGGLQQQLVETQKTSAYSMMYYIENSLMNSLVQTNQLTPQEKLICYKGINSSMEQINTEIKGKINEQIEAGALGQNNMDLSSALEMIELFDKFSIFIAPLATLTMIGFFSVVLKELVSVWSFVVWKMFGKEEIKEKDQNP